MGLLLVLREAWRGVARTGIVGVISVATMGVSLLVWGVFGQVIVRGYGLVDQLRAQVEIDIYFRDGVSQQRVFALRRKLEEMPEVAGTVYVDQDVAAKEFRALFGPDMVDALSRNPVPASLRVRISHGLDMPRRKQTVARAVSGYEGVESVDVGEIWVDKLEEFVQVITEVGLVLGGVLCLACAFAVGNTSKLMVLARRDAIEIMRLAGATDATVRMIFLAGGALQGFAGGVLASLMLSYASWWWTVRVPDLAVAPTIDLGFGLVVLGAVLGAIGAWSSLNRVLGAIEL